MQVFLDPQYIWVAFFSPLKMQEGVEKPQEHGPSTACFAWGSFGEKKTQKKQPLMEAPSNDAFRKATP